jgi:hypothetical protein
MFLLFKIFYLSCFLMLFANGVVIFHNTQHGVVCHFVWSPTFRAIHCMVSANTSIEEPTCWMDWTLNNYIYYFNSKGSTYVIVVVFCLWILLSPLNQPTCQNIGLLAHGYTHKKFVVVCLLLFFSFAQATCWVCNVGCYHGDRRLQNIE